MTFLLLHLGQLTRFLSRSESVMLKVKFFLQAVQVYSYAGIPSSSFAQRVTYSRHVGAYGAIIYQQHKRMIGDLAATCHSLTRELTRDRCLSLRVGW